MLWFFLFIASSCTNPECYHLVCCPSQILLLVPNSRLLLCAPSNSAADQLATRVLAVCPPSEMMRVNAYQRSRGTVSAFLIDKNVCRTENGFFKVPKPEVITRPGMRCIVTTCQMAMKVRLQTCVQRGVKFWWRRLSHNTHSTWHTSSETLFMSVSHMNQHLCFERHLKGSESWNEWMYCHLNVYISAHNDFAVVCKLCVSQGGYTLSAHAGHAERCDLRCAILEVWSCNHFTCKNIQQNPCVLYELHWFIWGIDYENVQIESFKSWKRCWMQVK